MLGTLADLASRTGGRVVGDSGVPIGRIASIEEAGSDALTFATSAAYLQAALRSRAAAVLVDESLVTAPCGKPLLVVPSARVALAALLGAFSAPRPKGPFRHASACVDESASIGAEVYVAAQAVIESGARIGDRAVIGAGAFVGKDAVVGEDVLMYPHARVLHECVIGDRTILHCGATIGSDGFGYVFVDGHFERIPQVGNAVLGADVEIGANTCVDRAQTGSTSIGDGTKIDNLVQIGHNCRIGKHTGMAAQTGLAGSTTMGDYVLVGGQAGFKGHITIGSRVKIAGGSAVWGDVPDDAFVSGRPARPHREELRQEVMLRTLPKLIARVDALEKREN